MIDPVVILALFTVFCGDEERPEFDDRQRFFPSTTSAVKFFKSCIDSPLCVGCKIYLLTTDEDDKLHSDLFLSYNP